MERLGLWYLFLWSCRSGHLAVHLLFVLVQCEPKTTTSKYFVHSQRIKNIEQLNLAGFFVTSDGTNEQKTKRRLLTCQKLLVRILFLTYLYILPCVASQERQSSCGVEGLVEFLPFLVPPILNASIIRVKPSIFRNSLYFWRWKFMEFGGYYIPGGERMSPICSAVLTNAEFRVRRTETGGH